MASKVKSRRVLAHPSLDRRKPGRDAPREALGARTAMDSQQPAMLGVRSGGPGAFREQKRSPSGGPGPAEPPQRRPPRTPSGTEVLTQPIL